MSALKKPQITQIFYSGNSAPLRELFSVESYISCAILEPSFPNLFLLNGNLWPMLTRCSRNKQARYHCFYQLSSLVVMMGILLPSFGPWLGLNVAAIQPNHSHVYLGDHYQHHHDLFLDRILPHAHPADDANNSVVSIPTTDILNSVYSLYLLFFLGTVLFGYHDTYSGKVENRKGFVRLFNFSPPYPPPRFPLLSNRT